MFSSKTATECFYGLSYPTLPWRAGHQAQFYSFCTPRLTKEIRAELFWKTMMAIVYKMVEIVAKYSTEFWIECHTVSIILLWNLRNFLIIDALLGT